MLSLRQFNRLSAEAAEDLLRDCLSVQRWVAAVAAGRPFRRFDDLLEVARDSAFPLTPAELEAALASHQPSPVVPGTYRGETALERRVREQLETGVELYWDRFGRPFLIQPAGRLPAQILVQLWERLAHDVDTEDRLLAQYVRRAALIQLANTVSR